MDFNQLVGCSHIVTLLTQVDSCSHLVGFRGLMGTLGKDSVYVLMETRITAGKVSCKFSWKHVWYSETFVSVFAKRVSLWPKLLCDNQHKPLRAVTTRMQSKRARKHHVTAQEMYMEYPRHPMTSAKPDSKPYYETNNIGCYCFLQGVYLRKIYCT